MLSALWNRRAGGLFSDEDYREDEQDEESQQLNQQQERGQAPDEKAGYQVQQSGIVEAKALRAIWDQAPNLQGTSSVGGSDVVATIAARSSDEQASSSIREARQKQQQTSSKTTTFDYEDPEERKERRADENKDNFAKTTLSQGSIETIGEARAYCEALVDKQLERAKESTPNMNEAIYGDAHAKRAIATLLPDETVRELFLQITKNMAAWPRIRPLFGAPPYNFLRPEDAGMVRAAGIASNRVNMTYDKVGETASYSQFGVEHLVDNYMREYRILPIGKVSVGQALPCDIDSVDQSSHIYMNVRVPKRSKAEKTALLKDAKTRRAVVFPQVGEDLTVQYSSALRRVWGVNKTVNKAPIRITIKSMIPRSATGATAAVVAMKV